MAHSLSTLCLSTKALVLFVPVILARAHHQQPLTTRDGAQVDLNWYPPSNSQINDLDTAVNGPKDGSGGVYGFIFNSSQLPSDVPYGTYNWCNMPHARKEEYVVPSKEYVLRYVEVMQRHHKRTPYASNSFPIESYPWNCDDEGLFYYGAPFTPNSHPPARVYWAGQISYINPFTPKGWTGTCQFPQITSGGLDDSWVHGKDLWGVYGEKIGFLPRGGEGEWKGKVAFRVTNNQITSQVAGMFISGFLSSSSGPAPPSPPGSGGPGGPAGPPPPHHHGRAPPSPPAQQQQQQQPQIPLLIQSTGIDSLEPQYPCPKSSSLFSSIKSNTRWKEHLSAATKLFSSLDAISGVPALPDDSYGFHTSFDHYFDNLSARECHAKPAPCKIGGSTGDCVRREQADNVYRLGQWEYSHIYRDAGPETLAASAASLGVWVAELASHLRAAMAGNGDALKYLHNFAHDGSTSRLLSILQIDEMVWPGMGAEIVFELYENAKEGGWFIRTLFGGRVLKSSHPSLGVMDMVPVETLLGYFDGLVGKDGGLVKGKCNA